MLVLGAEKQWPEVEVGFCRAGNILVCKDRAGVPVSPR